MKYTEEQIKEISRCSEDIEYFANTYVKMSTAYGVVSVKLNDFQRKVIEKYSKEKVFFIPAGRMEGKTTVAAIILLHQALFQDSRVSVIFARTKSNSNYIIELITEIYDRLPNFLSFIKLTTRNKSKLEFDNMCSIISAGSDLNYGRGRAISTIYIDESDFVSNLKDIINTLYPCMSSLSYSKLFALTSTFTGDTFRELGFKNA